MYFHFQIEELRDDYTLKVKLKDGAFNLGEALANQSSKGAKEKLQEVRGEQKELGEVRWDWGLGIGGDGSCTKDTDFRIFSRRCGV